MCCFKMCLRAVLSGTQNKCFDNLDCFFECPSFNPSYEVLVMLVFLLEKIPSIKGIWD